MDTSENLTEAVKAVLEKSIEDQIESQKTREAPKVVEWDDPLLRNETIELTVDEAYDLVMEAIDELDEARENKIPRKTVLKGVPKSRELRGPLKTTAIHTAKARKFLVLPSTKTTTVEKEPRLFGRKTSTTTNRLGRSAFRDKESNVGKTVDGMHTARARTMLGTPSKSAIVSRPEPTPIKQRAADAISHLTHRPEPSYSDRVKNMKPDEKASERNRNAQNAKTSLDNYHNAIEKGDHSAASIHHQEFKGHLNKLAMTSNRADASHLHSVATDVTNAHAQHVAVSDNSNKDLASGKKDAASTTHKVVQGVRKVRAWAGSKNARATLDRVQRDKARLNIRADSSADAVKSSKEKAHNAISRLAAESLQAIRDRK